MQYSFFPLSETALVFFSSLRISIVSFFQRLRSAFSSVVSFVLCRGRNEGVDGDEVVHHLLGHRVNVTQAVA